jgi:hypothetical protein
MEKPKVDARERLLDAWVVASKKNDAEAKAEAQAKIDRITVGPDGTLGLQPAGIE